jgi:hypothetical protein
MADFILSLFQGQRSNASLCRASAFFPQAASCRFPGLVPACRHAGVKSRAGSTVGGGSVYRYLKYLPKPLAWLLGAALCLLGLYAAAGFWFLPYLIRVQAPPRLAASFGVRLAVESVALDPFAYTIDLRGVTLQGPEGHPVLSLGEFAADLDVLATLRQAQAVFTVQITAPTLRIERLKDGRFNLLALLPPDDGKPSAGLPPFLLSRLSLAQGRIEYHDPTGRTPFAAALGGITLNLENLGTQAGQTARFDWTARLNDRGEWAGRGGFTLAPLVVEGQLDVAGIEPAPWLARFAPATDWRLLSGALGFKAEYRYQGGDHPGLELKGQIQGENLAAGSGKGGADLKIGKLALQGFSYALAGQRVGLEKAEAEGLAVSGVEFAKLALGGIAYSLKDRRLQLATATAEHAAGPGWTLAKLAAAGLAYQGAEQRASLESAQAEGAATPWAKVAKLGAAALRYDLAGQSFAAQSATLAGAMADQDGTAGPAAALGPVDLVPARGREIPKLARIVGLTAKDISGSLRKRSLEIGSLTTEAGEAGLLRTQSGAWRVPGLPDEAQGQDRAGKSPQSTADASGAPWSVRVGEFRLSGYALGFRDESVEPPVRINLVPATVRITGFSTEPGRQFQYYVLTGLGEQGKVELDGQAQLSPLRSELRFGVDKLWLRSLQPYWDSRVNFELRQGRLNLWGDLVVREAEDWSVDYSGAADIVELTLADKREHQDLLRWKSLKFDGVVVGTSSRRVSVRTITASQPYARVLIAQDGTLNLARDLAASAPAQKSAPPVRPAAATAEPGWSAVVSAVRFVDGRMDFTDQTLKPNFATAIERLEGNIRGLSSQESAKAELFLEGRVNGNAPAKIYGQAYPARFGANTDIAVQFRGVNLATLSPYSSKFAGYRIEKGKLDLDLRYRLKDRKLEVDNRAVLDRFVLGERVDSPQASSMPLDLAVALLKDSQGRIDLDLPIQGDLSDPQFSLSDLYATAFQRMLSKLVSSPFALLGSLIPDGDAELDYVSFQPGVALLVDTEKAKLEKIAEALKQRPALSLDIKGAADPGQDRLALAEVALLRELRTARATELRAQGQRNTRPEALILSDEDYRRLFTRYYRSRKARGSVAGPAVADAGTALAGLPLEQAKREVLEGWPVSELELRLLAQARGQGIHDYMVDQEGLPERRVYLLDVSVEPGQGQGVKARLSLGGS